MTMTEHAIGWASFFLLGWVWRGALEEMRRCRREKRKLR